jgi:DNA (cytosine-5)-methyltransferase 1
MVGVLAMNTPALKPPYRVPTMAEINARPYSGVVAVSTFSGGGGSSLGYRMAGVRTVWANEFIAAARDTYRANFPETQLDARDIRTVTAADILAATGLAAGRIDILDGSPPCAAFSRSGGGPRLWGRSKPYSDSARQVVDDLFFEYARLLRGLQPRVFIAENVKGLVIGKNKGYFRLILAELRACGYRVEARVVNAAWLGVPQARERLIFIGVREDLGLSPVYPAPQPFAFTVRDALSDLDQKPEPDVSMAGFQVGAEWRTMRNGHKSNRYQNLVRPRWDVPCPTISARAGKPSVASVAHPDECRKFSVAEVRRLCSFPDDFVLTGDTEQKVERMGRAVPPVMMAAIVSTVSERILSKAT